MSEMGACNGRLAAIVPTWNEAGAIAGTVSGLRAAGACCVFVVDAGSTDGTQSAARQAGATVVAEPRRGYGRACLSGSAAALGHRLVAFVDGDGSCDPGDLVAMAAECERGADLVLGRRQQPDPGALAAHARLGNGLVVRLIRSRTSRAIHDLTPIKVIQADVLHALDLDASGYGWTVQLIGRALAHPGVRVVEVGASFHPRAGGRSKVSGRLLPSIRAGAAMLGEAWRATSRRGLLVLMAKAPGAGHSKTRLEPVLGATETAAFWEACLQDAGARLRRVALAARLNALAMTSSEADADAVRRLTRLPVLVQRAPGLGQALLEVSELPAPFTIAVSADVPSLPDERLRSAIAAMSMHRAVLGPGTDGGYYLVGLRRGFSRRRRLSAYLEAPLGSSGAFEHSQRALGEVHVLDPWPDVDSMPELLQLASELRDDPHGAPAVSAWLARRSADVEAAG